jgi:predicted amidohydrolase YtcJ
LQPGYLADVIILTKDLFSIPASQVYTTRVALTIANGRVVYQMPLAEEMIKE